MEILRKRIGDLFDIRAGGTPSRSRADYYGGKIPWVKISDMLQGKITSTEETITDLGLENSGAKLLPKGTLLISIFATVGRTAELAIDATTNQAIVGLVPKTNGFDKKYIRAYLDFKAQSLKDISRGVAQNNINKSILSDIEIPLPDLKTQQKIASILEQADAARQKRKKANLFTEQFLQSAFLEMFGDPVRNEKGWEVKRLEEISDKTQIGPFGTQLHEEDYIENGIPLINPRHINSGKIEADYKQTITREKFATLSNYHLKIGDVIMGRRGEMGRCALISKREEGWLCGTGSLYIRPGKQINPHYLIFVIGNSSFIKQLENDAQGVTMMNLNLTIVNNRSIPVPPLPLQQKFTALVEQVERLRTKQRESERELDNLFQSLMQRYFG